VTYCSARAVTVVIFGHFNRSFYLLTYLLTYLLMERFIIPSIRFAFEHAWLHCRDDFKSLVIMIYDSEVLLHFCALKLLSLHEV